MNVFELLVFTCPVLLLKLISLHIGHIGQCHVCTQFFNTLRHVLLMQGFCLLITAQRLIKFYHPGCMISVSGMETPQHSS